MARLKLFLILTSLILACLVAGGSPQAQTIRGHGAHSGHAHNGHSYYYRPYPYYPWYPYGPFYNYGFFGYTYYPYAYPPRAQPYAYYGGTPGGVPASDVGWIDTDVSPEKAQVYVDGKYMGVADNFDGYPGFLALKAGEHTISFKSPGRQTVSQTVDVPGGAMLNFDFNMAKPGKGEKPPAQEEELIAPASSGYQNGQKGAQVEMAAGEPADQQSPASLKIEVSPPDASVYIDGEFMGTGSALSRLHGSLRLDSGRHIVEVARPGYKTISREVKLGPGERSSLEIVLDRD
ncbi:MAG: PEGA domain-containing protein [Candidatus Polarisedimenticolia bacterium]